MKGDRLDACIENVCLNVFKCSKDDITNEQKEAMMLMYMWGTRSNGFKDPYVALEYR